MDYIPEEDGATFLIKPQGAAKAIGKGAENLKRFREATGRRITVYVYQNDEMKFLQSLFRRFQVEGIDVSDEHGKRTAVVKVALKDKARAIGRGGRNLTVVAELARRHTDVKSIRID